MTALRSSNNGALRVLVVDDEPDLEALIRQRFRREVHERKFEFFFASNGEEALSLLDTESGIALVLTDINMPRMDGLTLLNHLAERDAALKAVVVSAYGDMDNIRTAMNRGAFDFLTKPIDFTDLDITIEKTRQEIVRIRSDREARDALMALRHELEFASQIQRSMLPHGPLPAIERGEIDLVGRMETAEEVGGDFYDYFSLPGGRIALVIGDVSGKGMPAALYMAMTRTVLRAAALGGASPADTCRRANDVLCEDNQSNMFVTVFYGEMDPRTGQLEICNAGHNPPCVLRQSGDVTISPAIGGMVLGVRRDQEFETATIALAPGDALVMYTDGATEAMDVNRRLFTEERLVSLLGRQTAAPLRDLVTSIYESVAEFASGMRQHDDITVLAIRFHRPAGGGGGPPN
jgi:sigma-B regulation protein RsbU (phosphoserine phosphatase)